MKKIVIVNQPYRNRGDESAHRALVRSLLSNISDIEINILTILGNIEEKDVESFIVESDKVHYCNLSGELKYWYILYLRGARFPLLKWLWRFHPLTNSISEYYRDCDLIICAPGGICMGGFQVWQHIMLLDLAKRMKKPIAYFGRSIGPFPVTTVNNRLFKAISVSLLHYMQFISLRDNKSVGLCRELGGECIPTTDTAFLETPDVNLPKEITELISNQQYVVVVPNLLIWHYAYKGKIARKEIVLFWCNVIEAIALKYPKNKILMLPQTYGSKVNPSVENDIILFQEIRNSLKYANLYVVSDAYSSDTQQKIIKGAVFLVGARYHSIVFAINNKTPFVSLSYEHKMSGLLELINAKSNMIDISGDVLFSQEGRTKVVNQLQSLLNNTTDIDKYTQKAKDYAFQAFNQFLNFIN